MARIAHQSRKWGRYELALLGLVPGLAGLALLPGARVSAQEPIVPAQDGLNTQLIQQGDRTLIQGGQLSGDGGNLFHGFDRFNVPTGHTAEFQAQPQLRNILGRISGGEPSLIDGTIEVSGGNPNLFLLNPAGAIFGPNSQLNVPASFHFSTADQVQFGTGLGLGVWDPSASALVSDFNGDPTGFGFSNPASLVNFGALAVVPGADLTLMGGTVLNMGSLSAPGGTVTLAAVEPGMVQLSRVDGILNLEFQAAAIAPSTTAFSPLRLPELLTGSNLPAADAVAVDATTGAVTLGRTIVTADNGTAIAGGSLNASSTTGIGGTINVLGDRVAIAGGNLTTTGPTGGGLIQVGGGFQGNGPVWNAQNTSVDSLSVFDVSATQNGPGGTAIAWADGNTWFEGTAIARGGPLGGNGGLVETSGLAYLDASRAIVDASSPLGLAGTWLLDPDDLTVIDSGAEVNLNPPTAGNPVEFSPTAGPGISTITDDTIEARLNAGTSVTLLANQDITVDAAIDKTAGGDAIFRLEAGRNITFDADISSTMGRLSVEAEATGALATVTLASGDAISTNGGDVTFTVPFGEARLQSNSMVNTSGGAVATTADSITVLPGAQITTQGGNVQLTADAGITLAGATLQTQAGNITLIGDNDASGGGRVWLQAMTNLETTSGNITLTGEGAAPASPMADSGVGVSVSGSEVTTGTGNISMTGIGGSNSTTSANGLEIVDDSTVSGGGTITIIGTGDTTTTPGDTAGENQGIVIEGAATTITATGTGLTTITGTAGNILANTHVGHGVTLDSDTTISVAEGGLLMTGNGTGTGVNLGHGLNLSGTIAASGNGNIVLNGNGSDDVGNNNHGIFVGNEGLVQVTNGSATLTGIARGTGNNNSGVVLNANTGGMTAIVEATGTGNVTLDGRRGNGDVDNNDVFVGGIVRGQGGTVTLRSDPGGITTRTGDGNDGVVITGPNGLVSTTGGTIAITGTAAAGDALNRGIAVENPTVPGPAQDTGIAALDGGTVTLNGTSTGTGTENSGVVIDGNITIANGTTVTITGVGTTGGTDSDGVSVTGQLGVLAAAPTGSFSLTGTGATAGVKVQGSVASIDGDITLNGTGSDRGIQIEGTVETTGSGTLRATGVATMSGGDGINVNLAGAVARAAGTGDAIFDATGSGVGTDFEVSETGGNAAAGASANTGLFSLTTERDLTFANDRTFIGDVFLQSRTGDVAVQDVTSTQGSLEFFSVQGDISYVDLDANTTINLEANQGSVNGNSILALGNTTVRAQDEILVTGTIVSGGYDARSTGDRFEGTTVNGTDAINIIANGNLTVGDITNPGNSILIQSETGQIIAGNLSTTAATGGAITVMAQTQITSGFLNSRGTIANGGNIFVDPIGDVIISWIDASGGVSGTGGTVFVETTGGDLRLTALVPDPSCLGASVCTTSGSNLALRHGGASAGGAPTFEVGDPTVNGSTGSLTNGVNTIPTGLSLLSTPATSFVDGGVSVTPGEILTPNNPA
ncbi:MAG: filamentous hemagglutinin N-terminal domain-containing protein, partial [Cyanobacteria bacterium P01_H01_bin.130]